MTPDQSTKSISQQGRCSAAARTGETGAGTAYEVQTYTICDGWVNTWIIEYHDGTSEFETFASREDAQAALDEFLAEIAEEIALGMREADEGYDRDDFRVVPVGLP